MKQQKKTIQNAHFFHSLVVVESSISVSFNENKKNSGAGSNINCTRLNPSKREYQTVLLPKLAATLDQIKMPHKAAIMIIG